MKRALTMICLCYPFAVCAQTTPKAVDGRYQLLSAKVTEPRSESYKIFRIDTKTGKTWELSIPPFVDNQTPIKTPYWFPVFEEDEVAQRLREAKKASEK